MDTQEYKCLHEGCGKKYSNAFNLKRHTESFHQGIKKFFCHICNKGLSSKQNMREHLFIHEDIKPYSCSFRNCKESFRQLSQCKLHENIHREIERRISKINSEFTTDFVLFRHLVRKVDHNIVEEEVFQDFKDPLLLEPEGNFKKDLKVNSGKT